MLHALVLNLRSDDTTAMTPRRWKLPLLAAASVLALAAGPARVAAHGNEPHRSGPNLDMVRTAFGQTGDPRRVSRTVRVVMSDSMRFDPAELTVRQGDTVRFVVHNRGKLLHEFVLGTDRDLREHAELMKKYPNMEHEDPYMAHVAPGAKGEVVWQFTQAGEFNFGCLLPGHFEAGMIGRVRVVAR